MELKNTDLRIGNWVLIPSKDMEVYIPSIPMKVDGSEFYGHRLIFGTSPHIVPLVWDLRHVSPMELRVEHLAGSGFVLQPWGYVKGKFLMTKDFLFRVGNGFDKQIKYVHELQNLYHSLTNEDLVLNCGLNQIVEDRA